MKKKFKFLNFISIIIILIFHFKYCFNQFYNYSFLTFNLQTFINNSNNSDDGKNFIQSYLNSLYYTEILLDSSEQKYIMQINLDDYNFQLTN
jgi:hypothetical protein